MTRPSLPQLEALLWIQRLGSFRAAAQRLGVTQPALSQRISELERGIGARVLDRRRARPLPTALGRDLLVYAERMVALADDMNAALRGAPALAGTLRIGVADSFATTCMPRLLVELGERLPALRVDVSVDYSASLDNGLRRGDLDLAVLTAPRVTEAVVVEPLVAMELRWAAAPGFAPPVDVLRPHMLVDVPIVTNPSPSHLFASVRAWFATAGLAPRRLNTCNSLVVMARLAAGGAGVSLLPPPIIRNELAAGTLRLLRARPTLPAHQMMIAYRRDAPQHLARSVVALIRPLVRASDLAPRAADRR
jgi:DNA-binding transcriptional LysR family regulator